MFLVSLGIIVYINKFCGWPTREQATYNWPWEKHGLSKFKPQNLNIWPCDVLIVIAKAKRIGNCNRLNCLGPSVGIIGIRGSKKFSALNFPFPR